MPIILVSKATPSDLVLQAAARMEPALAKAFLEAVEAMQDSVSIKKLTEALATGDVNEALSVVALDKQFVKYLNGQGLEPGIKSFADAVEATFKAGITAAAKQLPTGVAVNLSFNLMSPEAVKFLEKYQFDMIKQVTTETTDAIRQTILRAFNEGGHPYEQARKIKEFIGLTARQEQAVANFRRALSDNSTLRDAMNRALRDGRYDPTLLKAIRNGTNLSQAQIDKMVARYRQRFLQYRAQMIARTESIRASSKGRTDLWRQAEEQGLFKGRTVMQEWVTSGDGRTCPDCRALDGAQVPLGEGFGGGIKEPPDPHPDCRCSVRLVFIN